MNKISCIIPAYNEGSRIKSVLDVVTRHSSLSQIIVVDDASRDDTAKVVSEYSSVTYILHSQNKGKSASIYDGFKAATGDYVLFLDADLVGLTLVDIDNLIAPIARNSASVSISYRGNSPRLWKLVGFDYISGERVLRKKMLENHIERILTLPKFGLEVFLNSLIIANQEKIAIIEWPTVASPYKSKKYGFWRGVYSDIKMMRDIFATVGVFGPLVQIYKMKKLIISRNS